MVVGWLLAGVVAVCSAAPADTTDHPLLPRMSGFQIQDKQAKPFDALDLKDYEVLGKVPGQKFPWHFEGKITVIKYVDSTQSKSNLQIYLNYEAALHKAGAVEINAGFPRDSDGVRLGYHVFRLPAAANVGPAYVLLYVNSPQLYTLTFIEPIAMTQEITAGQLADEIKSQGYATLHLNFDTNKFDLKSDGVATVGQIVALLKADPALRLSIEGHTDNVGTAAANKQLSADRARAVMTAVAGQGIDAHRLAVKGLGAEVPVADNRTEDGRAKNRRVELVKSK